MEGEDDTSWSARPTTRKWWQLTASEYGGIFLGGIGVITLAFLVLDTFVLDQTPWQKKEIEDTVFVCKWQSICASYPKTRDLCATAGSYDKCMEAKIGSSEDYGYAISYCNTDGNFTAPNVKRRDIVQCTTDEIKAWRLNLK